MSGTIVRHPPHYEEHYFSQQRLYLRPLPHGQGSFLPILTAFLATNCESKASSSSSSYSFILDPIVVLDESTPYFNTDTGVTKIYFAVIVRDSEKVNSGRGKQPDSKPCGQCGWWQGPPCGHPQPRRPGSGHLTLPESAWPVESLPLKG